MREHDDKAKPRGLDGAADGSEARTDSTLRALTRALGEEAERGDVLQRRLRRLRERATETNETLRSRAESAEARATAAESAIEGLRVSSARAKESEEALRAECDARKAERDDLKAQRYDLKSEVDWMNRKWREHGDLCPTAAISPESNEPGSTVQLRVQMVSDEWVGESVTGKRAAALYIAGVILSVAEANGYIDDLGSNTSSMTISGKFDPDPEIGVLGRPYPSPPSGGTVSIRFEAPEESTEKKEESES